MITLLFKQAYLLGYLFECMFLFLNLSPNNNLLTAEIIKALDINAQYFNSQVFVSPNLSKLNLEERNFAL